MEDAHTSLMRKVHEYYKLHQRWQARQTHVAGIELRRLLAEIRDLTITRREEIQAIRATKPKVKSPKYKESLLKDREANKN